MIKTSKKALVLGLCLFSFANLFAQTQIKAEEVFNGQLLPNLRKEGRVTRYFTEKDNTGFMYTPALPLAQEAIKKWETERDYNANYSVESVYHLKKADHLKNDSPEEEKAKINKIIRSISKMEGVEYFSQSRGKVQVLYSQAYTMNNLDERKRIEDYENSDENPIYVFLDDRSFGEYASEVTYNSLNNETCFELRNVDGINYGLIKALKPDNMYVFLDVVSLEDEYVIYVFIQSKLGVPSIFMNIITDSFINRTDALFNWFKTEYDKL